MSCMFKIYPIILKNNAYLIKLSERHLVLINAQFGYKLLVELTQILQFKD